MNKHASNRQQDSSFGNDSDGLIQNPEWGRLQESLQDMVAIESQHVQQELLTNSILRAVRSTKAGVKGIDELWSRALLTWFRPVMIAGILLIFLLAAYNVRQTRSDSVNLTTTERVLGLHPVTVASAYDLDLESISR